MKGNKAAPAAKSSPEWRSCRGTNEGRETRRQAQNGDQEGRQMKGDKAAGAATSSPEWRSRRETNEGRQGGSGSQEQARMEIRPFGDCGDQQLNL